jgi:hypothetical protein
MPLIPNHMRDERKMRGLPIRARQKWALAPFLLWQIDLLRKPWLIKLAGFKQHYPQPQSVSGIQFQEYDCAASDSGLACQMPAIV